MLKPQANFFAEGVAEKARGILRISPSSELGPDRRANSDEGENYVPAGLQGRRRVFHNSQRKQLSLKKNVWQRTNPLSRSLGNALPRKPEGEGVFL